MIKYDFKIEKNIPIPKLKGLTQFLRSLEVGDSVVIPWPKTKPNQMTNFGKRANIKILSRRIDEEFIRIWRIE